MGFFLHLVISSFQTRSPNCNGVELIHEYIAFADIAIKNSGNALIDVTAAAGVEICNILSENSMRRRNIA